MRKPLEVFAIDADMNRASGTIPYTSLIWTRRYYDFGEFMLVVPADVYDPGWAYVYADERPETGIIQKVEYSDTAHAPDGRDAVTLSGFFLESMLNRVTFLVEQPEEQKVELPPPKMVGMAPKDFPTIYRASNGTYVYKDKQGNFIDSDGEQCDPSSDWEEVHTGVMLQHAVSGLWVYDSTPVYSNFNYAVNNEDGTVTITSWWGGSRTEDIVLQDDRGNAFFESGGRVCIANGSISLRSAVNYRATMDAWESGEEGVRYRVVTVKGPWQRTDTMEPITESDSVDQLFRWIQRFCGSSFIYVEPDIEGVVKTLDPSLQYLGDFAYKTLKEVEASYRVVYSFTNDRTFLEVWRGKDRSQEDAYEEVAQPAALAERSVPAPAAAAGPAALPHGYSRLEYIESTGTQWIDTGLAADETAVADLSFQLVSLPADWGGVFGCRDTAQGLVGVSLFASKGSNAYQCSHGQNIIGIGGNEFGSFDSGRHSFHVGADGATFDSQVVQTFGPGAFTTGGSMWLFAVNDMTTVYTYTSCIRVSSFAATCASGSVNLVPARRDSDSVLGMYDTVSGRFMENAGTGSFVAGPDTFEFGPLPDPADVIMPAGYTQVEYIETDGAQDWQQYIDTGFVPNGNSRLRMDCQMLQNSTNNYRGIAVARTGADSGNSFSLFIKNNTVYMSAYGQNIGVEEWPVTHQRTVITKDRFTTTIDGVSHDNPTPASVNPGTTMVLFDAKTGDVMTPESACAMRLWSCQLYDGDAKVRDFWPAVRDSDGAAGLVNVLTGEFYANAGSRPFATGAVVPKADWLNYEANSASASGETPPTAGTLGSAVTVAECGFSVPGKRFAAWNTMADGSGAAYAPGSAYTLTSGADVLYARWEDEQQPGPDPGHGVKAPWAVFSDTWGTIVGYSASRDTSNYKNTCFVLYQYDEPDEWEEDGRPVMKYGQIPPDYPWEEPEGSTGWYVPFTTRRGYRTASVNPGDEPDIETYLDLRSEGGAPVCDSDWSRTVYEGEEDDVPETMTPAEHFGIPPMRQQYEEWPRALTDRGVRHLRDSCCVITNLDTGTVNTDGYMVDFDLGDRVDFAVSRMGLAEVARIVEVEEVYESNGSSVTTDINVTVGDEKLGIIKKAALAR